MPDPKPNPNDAAISDFLTNFNAQLAARTNDRAAAPAATTPAKTTTSSSSGGTQYENSTDKAKREQADAIRAGDPGYRTRDQLESQGGFVKLSDTLYVNPQTGQQYGLDARTGNFQVSTYPASTANRQAAQAMAQQQAKGAPVNTAPGAVSTASSGGTAPASSVRPLIDTSEGRIGSVVMGKDDRPILGAGQRYLTPNLYVDASKSGRSPRVPDSLYNNLTIAVPKDYNAANAFAPGPNLVTQGFDYPYDFNGAAPGGESTLVPTGAQTAELRGGTAGGWGINTNSVLSDFGYRPSGDPVADSALAFELRAKAEEAGLTGQAAIDAFGPQQVDPTTLSPGSSAYFQEGAGPAETVTRTDSGYVFGGSSTGFAKGGNVRVRSRAMPMRRMPSSRYVRGFADGGEVDINGNPIEPYNPFGTPNFNSSLYGGDGSAEYANSNQSTQAAPASNNVYIGGNVPTVANALPTQSSALPATPTTPESNAVYDRTTTGPAQIFNHNGYVGPGGGQPGRTGAYYQANQWFQGSDEQRNAENNYQQDLANNGQQDLRGGSPDPYYTPGADPLPSPAPGSLGDTSGGGASDGGGVVGPMPGETPVIGGDQVATEDYLPWLKRQAEIDRQLSNDAYKWRAANLSGPTGIETGIGQDMTGLGGISGGIYYKPFNYGAGMRDIADTGLLNGSPAQPDAIRQQIASLYQQMSTADDATQASLNAQISSLNADLTRAVNAENLSRQYNTLNRYVKGYAAGGSMVTNEPIVGVGVMSKRPRFIVGEGMRDGALAPERLTFGGNGRMRIQPIGRPGRPIPPATLGIMSGALAGLRRAR